MAPESPNQKRKRGGPAGSQVASQDASQRATRRRRTDKEAETPTDEPPAEENNEAEDKENEKPGKRGRFKKGQLQKAEEKADAPAGGVRRSARDRRSADDSPWWMFGANGAEEQEEEAGESSAPPKKRARLSQEAVASGSKKPAARSRRTEEPTPAQPNTAKSARRTKARPAPAEEETAEAESEPRRRGRPRKSDDSVTRGEDAAGEAEPEPQRRGRPQKSDVSAAQDEPSIEEPGRPKQRGRPRLSILSGAGPIPSKGPKARPVAAHPRATKKPVTEGRRVSKGAQRRVSQSASSQAGNQSVVEMDDELEASLPPVPKYRQIEAKTRQIPRSTIDKWHPLDNASIEAISTIITDTYIPVLHQIGSNAVRRQHGQHILRIFAGRVHTKLQRGMPFPPATMTRPAGTKADAGSSRVEEFSFESTVDSIDSFETMLNPLLHSVALLEGEKAKEEAALEKEYETLRTLEANARAEARGWRERMKKAHPLALDSRGRGAIPEPEETKGEKLALVREKSTPLAGVFHDTEDEELLSMSKQIASHMVSIQKNVQPVQEVLPAIAKSRAALQSVLQTHLAPQQFERVLLG